MTVVVTGPRVEHRRDGLGIGTPRPRLSWRAQTAPPGWEQAASEIEVLDAGTGTRWTSGPLPGPNSVLVPWPAPPLRSRQRVSARVRVWGADGTESPWSDTTAIEAALLERSDWQARWVSPAGGSDSSSPSPLPWMRQTFTLDGEPSSARLYITALGVYEAAINATRCGDEVLAPGWTSYHHRLRYQVLDVTAQLRAGTNVIAAVLGDGWYRGRLGFEATRNIYGDRTALLAQLEVTMADGSIVTVSTDEQWVSRLGPILAADLYDGETYDARLELADLFAPAVDASWAPVEIIEPSCGQLVAPVGPPVRRTHELAAAEVIRLPSGRTIIDFGQNLVGRVRIRVAGPAGTEVVLRHAEVLENGELCTRTLRNAAATDRYTLRGGDDVEVWEPRFTFHGFRFVEVDGWPGELDPAAVIAIVCHSDLERTGTFQCSDERLNRLHANVVWGMRGNFLDVPTDCPQRDERLGWTGDLQVFAPTATFLFDVAGFLESWLADLVAEQAGDGNVPLVVPNVLRLDFAAAGWGDAAVVVPWEAYQRYGDRELLARQLPSMRAWVDHVERLAGRRRIWDHGYQFGDWLDPSAPNSDPSAGRTDRYLVATACFARCAELLGRAAAESGDDESATHYRELAAAVREAFRREYVTPSGRLVSDSQTAYAMALQFRLLEDPTQVAHAGSRLAAIVTQGGYLIGTGFLGTPLLCDALVDAGRPDLAYRMLTATGVPSWLYAVLMGATTIWERWDALLPDGSVNGESMTSFNHYAFGAIADWMHRTIGGISTVDVRARTSRLAPLPGGGLRSARATLQTAHGELSCAWALDGGVLTIEAVVPPNTTATAVSPVDGSERPLHAGSHCWEEAVPSELSRQWVPEGSSLDIPLGILRADPVTWTMVLEHLPDIGLVPAGSELDSRTIRDLVTAFAPTTPTTVLHRVEQALAGR